MALLTFKCGLSIMENLDEIIKEIRENTYDNELADIYLREFLGKEKEYD